ncbi:MAG: hypothetical protein Ta2A_25830 [Treponemataceae bacterium]|nr:MAG: hypothetical protein Ta2A_25830 [Treponemataceae bacterium]
MTSQKNISVPITRTFSQALFARAEVTLLLYLNRIVHFFIMGRRRSGFVHNLDYIRYSSLELVAREISERNVFGCVAELGVFKGDFAKNINASFPNKKLYLFDTFEGFDERDVKIEHENEFSSAKNEGYYNSSTELVLSKMKHPSMCAIKKGYFPETTHDIAGDEKFAFVSIDTDLYEPIYNGLKFFYPRLSAGGYIFVHDYNNAAFSGAKHAVRKFAQEYGVSYFPLSDGCGTAVFSK